MTKMYRLTHQTLTDLLDYDPVTGIFTWKVARSNRVKIGSRAGVFHAASGGRYVSIGNEKIRAHRLAFFYVNARWPNTDVRPVDGDYDNASYYNLREVSRVELAHQREKIATNSSGYVGVSPAHRSKWQAKITWNYRQISLGASFETAAEASEVYEEAARRLKGVTASDGKMDVVFREIDLWRRQRAVWRHLERDHVGHQWASFDAFCADVTDVPKVRYSMAPADATQPIGPTNFKWSLPIEMQINVKDDKIAYNRAKREANRDFFRGKDFMKKYGIDYAKYSQMHADQRGLCAICEKPETKTENGVARLLSVDHDHTTGAVRGLLCGNCNLAVGYACDDVTTLQKAIDYLERHDGVEPSQMDRDFADAMKRSPHRDWLPVATLGFGA